MSALEDQFLSLWQAHYPQLILEREFSDIAAWEADYQERYAKSKRSKGIVLTLLIPTVALASKSRVVFTIVVATSLVVAMSAIVENTILRIRAGGPSSS